jgi:YggT family protein
MMLLVINKLFQIYEIIILIRVIFSWIRVDQFHPVAQWIYWLTEPLLEPIRRVLPTNRIGIDFSPLLLLLIINLVHRMLIRILFPF